MPPWLLRFSAPVSAGVEHFQLYECAPGASRCDSASQVGSVTLATPKSTGNGRGVVLAPEGGKLKTGTTYSLVIDGLEIGTEPVALPAGSLAFRTRTARRGPLSDRVPEPELAVSRVFPDGNRPLLDFSTLGVRFNQPLAADTLEYGSSVTLSSGGELVPATLRVQDSALVVDPQGELTPRQ